MAFHKDVFFKRTFKEISIEESIDDRVVALVAAHPFSMVAQTMRDPENTRPIMLRYLGKFAMRYGSKKKNRNTNITTKENS